MKNKSWIYRNRCRWNPPGAFNLRNPCFPCDPRGRSSSESQCGSWSWTSCLNVNWKRNKFVSARACYFSVDNRWRFGKIDNQEIYLYIFYTYSSPKNYWQSIFYVPGSDWHNSVSLLVYIEQRYKLHLPHWLFQLPD